MHWPIIYTLWLKEVWRQLANRAGLCLVALLVVAGVVLPLLQPGDGSGQAKSPGVELCFIDSWRDDDWVRHLRSHVPDDLQRQVTFRNINEIALPGDLLTYPASAGAIQMRLEPDSTGKFRRRVSVWRPVEGGMAVFEAWFWRESASYFQQAAAATHRDSLFASDPNFGDNFVQDQATLNSQGDVRTSVTTALILFALFFSCVYLMPSLMCEERERGVLLAQALSPASPLDILAGKFLFYVPAGVALATLLAGVARPDVILEPLFWGALLVSAVGMMGIGLTIASLARSQRAASMGALCYLLVVALTLFFCRQIEVQPFFALEYHSPIMLNAALTHAVSGSSWVHCGIGAGLASLWTVLAVGLFRRRGWQ